MKMRSEFTERPNWLSGDQSEPDGVPPINYERMPVAYWLLRVCGVVAAMMLIGLQLLMLAGPITDAERPDLIVPMWRRLADASVAGVIGVAALVPDRWAGTGVVFVIRVATLALTGGWFASLWWGSLQRGSGRPLVMYSGIVAFGFLVAAGAALWWRSVRRAVPASELPN